MASRNCESRASAFQPARHDPSSRIDSGRDQGLDKQKHGWRQTQGRRSRSDWSGTSLRRRARAGARKGAPDGQAFGSSVVSTRRRSSGGPSEASGEVPCLLVVLIVGRGSGSKGKDEMASATPLEPSCEGAAAQRRTDPLWPVAHGELLAWLDQSECKGTLGLAEEPRLCSLGRGFGPNPPCTAGQGGAREKGLVRQRGLSSPVEASRNEGTAMEAVGKDMRIVAL